MTYQPPAPDSEVFRILIRRGQLVDGRRHDRVVPYKLYHPADESAGPFPVIIWSHGLGGSADGAGFLARFIAAQGYVVLNIQHHGTDSSLWEGKPGHPWDVIRATPIPRQAALDRFRDVYFVIDRLFAAAMTADEDFPAGVMACMDLDRLGMSGHSYGALTTQIMAGQGFPDLDGTIVTMPEDRIRAGILYSPTPIHYLTAAPDDELYGTLDIPLLHMTGTADDSPVEKFDYQKRLTIYAHAQAAEQYMQVLDGGDHMVFVGSRGQLGATANRERLETLIKISSLAFWDAYLKDKADARDWLKSGGWAAFCGDAATCAHKG